MTHSTRLTITTLLFLALGWFAPASAQVEKCTICHAKAELKKTLPSGQVVSLYVDDGRLARSAHGEKACTDCHADVEEIPHTAAPQEVDCTRCHYRDNQSGAPTDVDYTAYRNSVHGKLAAKGDPGAPTCHSCHGDHQVFGADDPRSRIARANVPETCGACHLKVYNEYIESVHGHGVKSGEAPDAAICTDCHGEHDIRGPNDPKSSVNPARIAETCGKCHDGTNPNYTAGKMHVDAQNPDAGIIYWVAQFFKWLTISTMVALLAHIFLDLNYRAREARKRSPRH